MRRVIPVLIVLLVVVFSVWKAHAGSVRTIQMGPSICSCCGPPPGPPGDLPASGQAGLLGTVTIYESVPIVGRWVWKWARWISTRNPILDTLPRHL